MDVQRLKLVSRSSKRPWTASSLTLRAAEPARLPSLVRRLRLVCMFGLLTACGSPAVAKVGSSAPPRSTAAPTPAPPIAPLTVQSSYTITDTDHLDVSGSSVPGASVVATGTYGVGGTTSLTATADAQGSFTLRFLGLPMGATQVDLAATAAGYSDGSANISVTRTLSPAAYKASAAAIPYNQLVKDPTALVGRVVTYTAQVFQYDTNTTTRHMIVAVTNSGYGFWNDNVWLDVDPTATASVCNKTVVRFWGDIVGPYSYTTTNNGSLTIPEIHVQYIAATQNPC